MCQLSRAAAAGVIESLAATHQPRLVWITADGRTELSGATLVNWIAKVAGLVGDELGAAAGETAIVLPTRSWQAVPAVLGCRWAGLAITTNAAATAPVGFVDAGQDCAADEVLVYSSHPFGFGVAAIAPHQQQFRDAVLAQSDTLGACAWPGDDPAAVDREAGGVTNSEAAGPGYWDGAHDTVARWLATWSAGGCVTVDLGAVGDSAATSAGTGP